MATQLVSLSLTRIRRRTGPRFTEAAAAYGEKGNDVLVSEGRKLRFRSIKNRNLGQESERNGNGSGNGGAMKGDMAWQGTVERSKEHKGVFLGIGLLLLASPLSFILEKAKALCNCSCFQFHDVEGPIHGCEAPFVDAYFSVPVLPPQPLFRVID